MNTIAGKHGVGRIDHVENRLVGIKSREVYEAPAAMTLIKAHKELEDITLVKDVAHFKPVIEKKLTELIYNGLWFSPLRGALIAFLAETQKTVTGTVRVKLFKGHAIVEGRKSEYSLYDEKLATYTKADEFDHDAAVGFIKIFGLPTAVNSMVNNKKVTSVSSKLWGGRFTKSAEEWVDEFGASISFDQELVIEDIQGSLAHVTMLKQTGILPAEDADKIIAGLKGLQAKAENGELTFKVEMEDIHLNLESMLIDEIGPVGGKLHTGRSRNDQVATDMHLYLRNQTKDVIALIKSLQEAIIEKAKVTC